MGPLVLQLNQVLSYNPETGLFVWLVSRNGTSGVGNVAGRKTDRGYWRITVDGKTYRAHRLAWWFVTGEWPADQIDHINGDRTDNRIANLRLADNSQNHANSKKYATNLSGFKGVSWSCDKNKWFARIMRNYRAKHLGYFDSPEQAHEAYVRAAEVVHGEFARAG